MRRKTKAESGESGGGWQIVYTGFILILLCFFIMLCSFSTIEKNKLSAVVMSFIGATRVLTGGDKIFEKEKVVPQQPKPKEEAKQLKEKAEQPKEKAV